jgi:gamma-glutamylcyclotransferase (GGCT)/AIG2-like uncharacterized protein YtfP
MAESMHIFTYGSLMFPTVWEGVVQGRYRNASATVRGFKRLSVCGEKYPGLVVDQNAATLTGKVYFDVSPVDLARLDHFETSDYGRVAVATLAEGEIVVAHAYMSLNPEKLEGLDWSPTAFEQHGIGEFLATYAATNAPPPID